MAPIPLKSIVSVSSEDPLNPASNLLSPVSMGKWLCAVENRLRTAEVVIELSKRTRITSLEICNFGSAFVEVHVSNSDSPDQAITLLHMSTLMTLQESRSGRSKNKTAFYSAEKLSASAVPLKWNRVKIKCVQKYNQSSQFGLRAISIFSGARSQNFTPFGPEATPLFSPPSSVSSSKLNHRHRHSSSSSPSLPESFAESPSSLTPKGNTAAQKTRTPQRSAKRNCKSDNISDDFEFSGLEKQSRLFRNCMRKEEGLNESGNDPLKTNQILERISADKDKYRGSTSCSNFPYQKKKLLKRDLPKAEVMRDFVDSYKEKKGSVEMAGACRKMSSHDNDYEIGEEPENTWGWGKSRGGRGRRRKVSSFSPGSGGGGGWLGKRRKLDTMIEKCSDILKKAGHGEESTTASSEVVQDQIPQIVELPPDDEVLNDTDSSGDTIIYSSILQNNSAPVNLSSSSPSPHLVECPLCLSFFPTYAIELHASQCCHHEDSVPSLSNRVIHID